MCRRYCCGENQSLATVFVKVFWHEAYCYDSGVRGSRFRFCLRFSFMLLILFLRLFSFFFSAAYETFFLPYLGIAASGGGTYHSVRKGKDRLGIHIRLKRSLYLRT